MIEAPHFIYRNKEAIMQAIRDIQERMAHEKIGMPSIRPITIPKEFEDSRYAQTKVGLKIFMKILSL